MTGSAVLNPERPIRHAGHGSSFLRMTGGVSLVRYWGVSDALSSSPRAFVPVEAAAADEPMTRESVAGRTNRLARPWNLRRPDAPQESPQDLNRVPFSRAQAR
jgi:hypothetical protein